MSDREKNHRFDCVQFELPCVWTIKMSFALFDRARNTLSFSKLMRNSLSTNKWSEDTHRQWQIIKNEKSTIMRFHFLSLQISYCSTWAFQSFLAYFFSFSLRHCFLSRFSQCSFFIVEMIYMHYEKFKSRISVCLWIRSLVQIEHCCNASLTNFVMIRSKEMQTFSFCSSSSWNAIHSIASWLIDKCIVSFMF